VAVPFFLAFLAALAGWWWLRAGPTQTPARLPVLPFADAEAHDLYLRGRSIWHRGTAESNARAIEYFRRATGRDPRFALAWSGIADAHAGSAINADMPPLTVGRQARAAASQAYEIEPGLAEVQFSRGYVSFLIDWEWPGAEAAFRRSIAINPGFSLAHLYLGHVLSQMRRHAEAQSETRRAAELDPLNPMSHAIASQVAFQARDYPAALEYAKRAATLDPEFWIAYMQLAQVYEQLGKTDLAVEAAIKAARLSGGNTKTHSIRGYILARTGQTAEAREVLEALEVIGRKRFVPPYDLALVHAGLGDRDAAFAWLAKAYDVRDVHLIFLTVDPKWDPYRNDPRFEALLKRCGFHLEQ
jgi:tetratricopeptide (TPR) repeat protein